VLQWYFIPVNTCRMVLFTAEVASDDGGVSTGVISLSVMWSQASARQSSLSLTV